jgi:hypothetical protein
VKDADPLGLVVSMNKRRKPNASQMAMAAASAWAAAEAEGPVQTKGGNRKSNAQLGHLISEPREYFAGLFGVGKNYVEHARALLKYDPIGAAAVRAGEPIKEHYEALQKRERSVFNRPAGSDERRTPAAIALLCPDAPTGRGAVDPAKKSAETAEISVRRLELARQISVCPTNWWTR